MNINVKQHNFHSRYLVTINNEVEVHIFEMYNFKEPFFSFTVGKCFGKFKFVLWQRFQLLSMILVSIKKPFCLNYSRKDLLKIITCNFQDMVITCLPQRENLFFFMFSLGDTMLSYPIAVWKKNRIIFRYSFWVYRKRKKRSRHIVDFNQWFRWPLWLSCIKL